jgi:hypothetical protein
VGIINRRKSRQTWVIDWNFDKTGWNWIFVCGLFETSRLRCQPKTHRYDDKLLLPCYRSMW